MKIYDISITISDEMPLYPGDPNVVMQSACSISNNDSCNVTRLSLGSHTGTHIDVPKHYIDNGLTTDKIDLTHFIGRAKVFDLSNYDRIDYDYVKNLDIKKDDIIILKTKNSQYINNSEFNKDFIAINLDVAQFLAEIKIKTVGIDYLSIESFYSKDSMVHKTLLGNGICVVEGLDLSAVPQGEYNFSALPLKIKDCDGSPVRAILY